MLNRNDVNDVRQMNMTSQMAPYFPSFSTLPKEIGNCIVHHYKDILIVCDSEGDIEYVSDSIERILGYKREQFLGNEWKLTVSEQTEEYITRKIATPVDKEVFTLEFPHANGTDMWLQCVVRSVYVEELRKQYVVFIYSDITDRKKTEEFMIQAEKMSVAGQLAVGIAHEIRNPLTALKGFLQLLQSGIENKETYYRIMMDELTKIEKVTSELLYISKPMTNALEEHSVNEMMSDIVALFRPHAITKGIEIIFHEQEQLYAYCDQTQIKQVFINLLKNAIEIMDEPGSIIVTCKQLGDFVQIDVIDEGPGIDESIAHNLNEPFVTTKKDGTGLGLVITKQIIDRHNGELEVLVNELTGSTFRIRLPKGE